MCPDWNRVVVRFTLALVLFGASSVVALSMNNHRINQFEREAVKAFTHIARLDAMYAGDRTVWEIRDEAISGFVVAEGNLTCRGLSEATRKAFSDGKGTFADLRTIESMSGHVVLREADLQAFIDREIARQPETKAIFSEARIKVDEDRVTVTGQIYLSRLPENMLGFLAPDAAPFTVSVGLAMSGSRIDITIEDGMVNEQPITPELRQQVLSWLNPLWDTAKLPYPAAITRLRLAPGRIAVSGWLFAAP